MCRHAILFSFGFCVLAAVVVPTGSAHGQGFVPRGANAARATRDYILNRPTVSPYLNLTRRETEFSSPNYQTLVRPALEQRDYDAQQSASVRRLQSQVVNLQGQMALSQQRQRGQFSSGHPTRFFTYLHYYPQLNRR